MNDLSLRCDPFGTRVQGESDDFDSERQMNDPRKSAPESKPRLTRDSPWARALAGMVAQAAPPEAVAQPVSHHLISPFTGGHPAQHPPERRSRSRDIALRSLFHEPVEIEQPARTEAWGQLTPVMPRAKRRAPGAAPLIDHYRDTKVADAFDLLRTRLVHTIRKNGWSRIAIASPVRGCGSTFTAVNLAMSLARVPGTRTILIDMNQRDPGIAEALDLQTNGEIRNFLTAQVPLADYLQRYSDTLALGLTAEPFRDSAEVLHDRRTGQVLDDMQARLVPDVVLYDMPSVLDHDDLGAFLPQVDGVLLIADGTRTTARQITDCERMLADQCPLLGVILNRARQPILKRNDR
ncbi:CpsD/CapB family tyrosine-protein kinase [Oceaniovalibus sp. ACAM 378]|uniref:CpsD/CapB family tyrosine-protein kinase n=1 Tax=Oceaniovalibus sp. ACAM 378 TaxID=2599923 RepID=UPI0011DC708A|nr:CpsD/CapB family tyrosine-protein kinase [Oceaniovalibus sp. ACAM 378]TYB89855.1 CpsD/CapB family tyrosine-protein kinase [Oceaniovalibus sp. ACAM 378]